MGNADQITTNAIFDVLSSSRRRHLLYHLYRRGMEAHLRDLAEDTAAAEFGRPLEEEQIKRIYIAFYQTHIPKLEEVGFVAYDRDEQWVELQDEVRQMARVLPNGDGTSRPWPLYYATVAVAGLVIAAATFAGVAGTTELLTTPVVAGVMSLVLLVLSFLYYWERSRQRQDYTFLERLVSE